MYILTIKAQKILFKTTSDKLLLLFVLNKLRFKSHRGLHPASFSALGIIRFWLDALTLIVHRIESFKATKLALYLRPKLKKGKVTGRFLTPLLCLEIQRVHSCVRVHSYRHGIAAVPVDVVACKAHHRYVGIPEWVKSHVVH